MKKVFVAMSGGVDSSVSAVLLKKQGYDVTGVFMKVWSPDFLECTRGDDRREAMRAAAHLNIPFLTFDFEKEYKQEVVDYMISEYKTGRTPNPDVMCNKHIKFGVFLKKAREMGADFIATGHYARLGREFPISNFQFLNNDKIFKNSNIENSFKIENLKLKIAKDRNKDQSYFLWTFTQEQLRHIIFPIGELTKPEVRKLAREFGLPNADRKESQGVCFIGEFKMKDFLKHYITSKCGDILDEKSEIIGTNEGAHYYTIGERHGFMITKKTPNDKPYYVIAKDVEKNTITVSNNLKKDVVKKEVFIENTNWISGVPEKDKIYKARIRYRQPLQSCWIEESKSKIIFNEPQKAIAPGQSLVLYENEECIGGGIIK